MTDLIPRRLRKPRRHPLYVIETPDRITLEQAHEIKTMWREAVARRNGPVVLAGMTVKELSR